MAELRIGVRVSLRGRALKVVDVAPSSDARRGVVIEDEETGERFVVTTRVVRCDKGAASERSSHEAL